MFCLFYFRSGTLALFNKYFARNYLIIPHYFSSLMHFNEANYSTCSWCTWQLWLISMTACFREDRKCCDHQRYKWRQKRIGTQSCSISESGADILFYPDRYPMGESLLIQRQLHAFSVCVTYMISKCESRELVLYSILHFLNSATHLLGNRWKILYRYRYFRDSCHRD